MITHSIKCYLYKSLGFHPQIVCCWIIRVWVLSYL